MADRPDDIDEVKKSIDRERTNLLTVVAALSFLCVCLFVSNISLGAYTVSAMNERDAVSVALDDQRVQYYRCVRDFTYAEDCGPDMVSPASRDIRRDLEGAGFADILYADRASDGSETDAPHANANKEAFGLLGRVVYGQFD